MIVDFHQMILNNKEMKLPVLKKMTLQDLESAKKFIQNVHADINIRCPILIEIETLSMDDQKKFLSLFSTKVNEDHKLSLIFPYPIYIKSQLKQNDSALLIIQEESDLPKFFLKKEGKINLKESQILMKNKLLQQEIQNADLSQVKEKIKSYANDHKKIFQLEVERMSYINILANLKKEKDT